MNETEIRLFVNIGKDGEIIESLAGPQVIPSDEYAYEFLVSPAVSNDLDNYKVLITDDVPELIKKE